MTIAQMVMITTKIMNQKHFLVMLNGKENYQK